MPPSNARHARLARLVYAVVAGALSLAAALAVPAGGVGSMAHFEWISLASVAVVAAILAVGGLWTATGVYAVVFWCFHFGLIAMLAVGVTKAQDLSPWDQLWVLGPFAPDAALLALAGSLAFASGAGLVQAFASSKPEGDPRPAVVETAHPHGAAGSIMVIGAVAVWCAIVAAAAGLEGFFGSYGEYLQATSDYSTASAAIWLVLGCGVVLSVTGKPGRLRTAAMAAFVGLALIVLPIGLRGEILFRTMAAFVACARCGRVLSPAKTAALGLALLLVIPVIREVRQAGLQGLPDVVLEPRLYEAFAEMGGSLHPVEKVVRWSAEGDAFDKGGSYWAPIERAAARLLPDLDSIPAEDDLRIMNILVTERVGPIGFSPVAEAYRNLGAVGVVLVLGLTGAALGAIDAVRNRRMAVLAIATVYIPVLTNVRNSFVSVPAHCAAGILIVVGLNLMRHVAASVLSRPYARPAYIRSKV